MQNRNKREKMRQQLIAHTIVIMLFAITAIKISAGAHNGVSVTETYASTPIVVESEKVEIIEPSSTEVHNEAIPTETEATEQPEMEMCPQFTYSKDWSEEEEYLLAKIAMAEAEGENIQTKTLVILTVLNRVQSDEFPDTIEEVIFQKRKSNGKTVYQFSPVIPGGRWYTTEPNEDCWEAVQVVKEAMYDYSGGATYFESCANEDNWHSRNLEFLYQSENMRFYR